MYELLEDMIGNAINIFFDLDYNFYNFLNDTFLYIVFAVILIEGKNYIVKKNITSEIDAVLDDVEEKQIKARLKKIIKEMELKRETLSALQSLLAEQKKG